MEDSDAPATKADIQDLRQEFRQLIERVETNLLTEFHKWAQPYEIRTRGPSRAVAEFDERLGLVDERPSRLEREPCQ